MAPAAKPGARSPITGRLFQIRAVRRQAGTTTHRATIARIVARWTTAPLQHDTTLRNGDLAQLVLVRSAMRNHRSLLARLVLMSLALGAGACGAEEDEELSEGSADAIRLVPGDRNDPAKAKEDRVVSTATLFGRSIALHLSDPDTAAWGSIDRGDPGDEVWIDRSFDSSLSWDGPKGRTSIPKGRRGWRTMMYKVHDRSIGAKVFPAIGAVRACGKAGNRAEIVCTDWFRTNVGDRVDAAATSLVSFYNPLTAQWSTTGWWNSANAMTALLDYMQQSGSNEHRWVVSRTFDFNWNRVRNFTNDYMDDTGWWGLAWIRAYDVTHEQRYLDMARRDADYMWSFKDDKCGGGVWWRSDKKYKNAITNELFIKLAASIHNRTPNDTVYRARAEEVWRWFEASGMINDRNEINDGLDFETCKNNGQWVWTYNQGVVLGALAELSRATRSNTYLDKARSLADASTKSATIHDAGGILREPCEGNADACGIDGPSFKGAYVRNLSELDRALTGRPYRTYLTKQANAVHANRTTLDTYGVRWSGRPDKIDAARQHSALEALTAAAW